MQQVIQDFLCWFDVVQPRLRAHEALVPEISLRRRMDSRNEPGPGRLETRFLTRCRKSKPPSNHPSVGSSIGGEGVHRKTAEGQPAKMGKVKEWVPHDLADASQVHATIRTLGYPYSLPMRALLRPTDKKWAKQDKGKHGIVRGRTNVLKTNFAYANDFSDLLVVL
uniref:Uncharacterized protein n=1 Tax=Trichuris muris TaxID=70415 RepID=A0A5S6Q907_TRIMR